MSLPREIEKGESEMAMHLVALSYTELVVDSENFKNMIKGHIHDIIILVMIHI